MTAALMRLRSTLSVNDVAHGMVVAAAVALGLVAHADGNPVSAALLFMFAVVLVASRAGLRTGLVAGTLASLAYNFWISSPPLRLGVSELDDLIPLLAFNISAVASAYVAGRLRDEARASEEASEKVSSLLRFSSDLQTAVDLAVMLEAARSAEPVLRHIEVVLADGRVFGRTDEDPSVPRRSTELQGRDHPSVTVSENFSGGTVTCLVPARHAAQAGAYLAIFAIAAERWVLTERLVEADVFRKSEWFKTTLLSSMSHDLRTPLSVIAASAESLLRYGDKLPADDKQDLLETIEHQAARLSRLTSKLLSLGRIEGGLSRENMPEIDALEVLGTALVSARQLAPDRLIHKTLELSTAPVRADPSLLEQVIYNVLENAIVHTPEEAPINVSVYARSGSLVIAIADQGPGIPAGQTEQIFERFHQASPSGQERGSGLGLSIARGFARAIDGDVTLVPANRDHSGARFEINLPMVVQSSAS